MKSAVLKGALLGLLLGLAVVTTGAVARRRGAAGGGLYRSLGTFSEVLTLVQGSYVEPVENRRLFEGAFDGLAGALDPSCDFVPPEKLNDFRRALSVPGVGVGVTLARRGGYATVTAVEPGSPAAKAGMDGGELLEAIDGRVTRGIALWESQAALRGDEGSTVSLSIIRPGKTKRETIRLVRKAFPALPPEVRQKDGVVIFHPARLDAKVAGSLEAALSKNPAGLILDLRGCSGEDFDAAASVASRFVPAGGSFAKEVSRQGEPREWRIPASSFRYEGSIAILTDPGTAGTAEVLSSFLVAQGRAKSAGETTAGTVGRRRLVALPSGGALYLTVVRYRPDGAVKAIDGSGVEPQEEVFAHYDPEGEGKDQILEKGLDLVLGREARRKTAA